MVHFAEISQRFWGLREATVQEYFIIFLTEQNNKTSSDINLLQARWLRDRIYVHI